MECAGPDGQGGGRKIGPPCRLPCSLDLVTFSIFFRPSVAAPAWSGGPAWAGWFERSVLGRGCL